MIDVTHKRDDGAAGLELFFFFNDRWGRGDNYLFDLVDASAFFPALLLENKAMVLRDFGGDIRLNRLIDICEDVETHQFGDDLMRL